MGIPGLLMCGERTLQMWHWMRRRWVIWLMERPFLL
jgi:hypothetical protein